MSRRVLHLLSQRPGWTGSGMALNAIAQAAAGRDWEQAVVLGTPADEPEPVVAGLDSRRTRPLVFDSSELPFALPGMSDVMPYRSSRFSELVSDQIAVYCDTWRRVVSEAIDEFQPDVIHSHHVWLLSSLIRDVTKTVPVVTHCHGTGLRQLQLCPNLSSRVRAGCARNDAFLALHRGHAEILQDKLGVAGDRVSVIGSGFREDVFHDRGRLDSCGRVVTYAGKLSHAKGLPWLLDAGERLADRVPGLELNVAGSGSGPEADQIRNRMHSGDHVVYHGQLEPRQLADLLRRSAVFVLPSFYEGLPLVLIEAAACGCRIVTTALPGVVDQLQPVLGDALELVPLPRLKNADQPLPADLPKFVDRLDHAIEVSLSRPGRTDGRALVADMTWEAVFDRIEHVWNRLIESGSRE